MKKKKLAFDAFGLLLAGDGLLTLLDPERHCLLWEIGPKPCREFLGKFVKHPRLAQCTAIAELLMGVALAQGQRPSQLKRWRNLN